MTSRSGKNSAHSLCACGGCGGHTRSLRIWSTTNSSSTRTLFHGDSAVARQHQHTGFIVLWRAAIGLRFQKVQDFLHGEKLVLTMCGLLVAHPCAPSPIMLICICRLRSAACSAQRSPIQTAAVPSTSARTTTINTSAMLCRSIAGLSHWYCSSVIAKPKWNCVRPSLAERPALCPLSRLRDVRDCTHGNVRSQTSRRCRQARTNGRRRGRSRGTCK